jgi:phosphatidylglycerol:prolipoprotein diacylglycerol transferase
METESTEASKYWVHNLSEYVFEVRNLNFDWVLTWYGILGLVVVIGGGFALLQLLISKRTKANLDAGNLLWLRGALGFAVLIFAALFGLKKAGYDWGLRWYSTMYVLAYTQVYLISLYWIRRRNIMLTQILLDSLIAYGFIGMLLGARLVYVFVYNWSYYSSNPIDALKVWHGGLSFHGGIIGVIIGMVLFCRKYQFPFWHLADRIVLLVPFGIGIGRIGNFLNRGELYGRVIGSDVPWAIIFPGGGPLPRHPSQLYQSLGEGWMLLLTLFIISRWKHREGVLGAAFVFFYGLYRFPVEFFREADEQLRYYFNNTLTMGQILCILTMLGGVFVFYLTRKNMLEGSEMWTRRLNDYLEKRKSEEAQA